MMKCIFVQPIYQRDLTKNSTRDFPSRCKKTDTIKTSCRPPQPTTDRTIIFFHKRGTPFFADRPPGSSYRPRRVESKGAAGISRQPITLRFVGYPTFPVGCAGFIVSYRLHTHNKKNMPTMGDVRHSLCRRPGSLPPIPAQRFHSLHRERRSAGSVFVFSRGGVSSIAFYTSDS